MKINKLLFILILSLLLVSPANAIVPKKIVEDIWNNLSAINNSINLSVQYKAEMYGTWIQPAYITGVKAGATDHIGNGLNYSHSRGMKFMLKIRPTDYATSREAFRTDTAAQDRYYSDLAWVLQRYPTLDGLELEEPQMYAEGTDGGVINKAFWNSVFVESKAIVVQYRDLSSFIWGFNFISTNTDTNVTRQGIDWVYINNNILFNAVFIQNGFTMSRYQSEVSRWTPRFSNLELGSYTYLHSQTFAACIQQFPTWNDPSCWNQVFFDQVEWAQTAGVPVDVFILGRLFRPASMWPNETTPGATAGDKLSYIWNITSSVVLTPTFSPPSGTYLTPQQVYITSGTANATIRYTTDGSTPSTSSSLYSSPIMISTNTTLKAKAWKAGYIDSGVGIASYAMPAEMPEEIEVNNNLKKSDPNTVFNQNTVNFIEAGCLSNCSTYVYRSILRLNITGYSVNSLYYLKLWWYHQNINRINPTDIQVFYVNKSFQTNGMNWYNRSMGVLWSNPGGDWLDSNSASQGTVPIDYVTLPVGSPTDAYIIFNVTKAVVWGINNASDNVSFMIKASPTNESQVNNYVAFHGVSWTNSLQTPVLENQSIPIYAPPSITSWGNNKTNNINLSFDVNLSEVVNFNVTANQSVSYSWYIDDNPTGGNFDNLTTSWSVGGFKEIHALTNNSNGSSGITWNVNVISPLIPSIPDNLSLTSGKHWANATWTANMTGNVSDSYRVKLYLYNPDNPEEDAEFLGETANTYYNFTDLDAYRYWKGYAFIRSYNNTYAYSDYSGATATVRIPTPIYYVASQANNSYIFIANPDRNYTIRTRANNSTYDTKSDWNETTVEVPNDVDVYNTGYQFVLVNGTMTNAEIDALWGTTWIIGWNVTSQRWENYKSGWNIRSSRTANKGDAVGIKVSTNKSVALTFNASYNWTLYTGQNLIGIEYTKNLSQINTSIGTCDVDKLEYTNLSTQTSYLFTCGESGNASVLVNAGEGFWANKSTAGTLDIVRVW